MTSPIRRTYDERVADGRLRPDPAQAAAVKALERLERDLKRRGLFGGRPAVKGLYLWGPPGRGKSILMDMFFAGAPESKKVRAHFHAFMARVHDLIRQWREGDRRARRRVFGEHAGDDPIGPVARLIAAEARLLCFDELQVVDIADAMILGRLFRELFDKKVILMVTSNRAPETLYADGINRELFLPFIDLLRQKCAVVEVAGAQDWRRDRLKSSRVWHAPLDADQRAAFEALWADLKGEMDECPATLKLLGRELSVERTAGGLARGTFDDWCARPLGPQDYLAVAQRFHTVFIEDLPRLGPDRRHSARRLVTFVDALYEARTRLVVLAEAGPDALYPAGDGAFEFQRTASRLQEMSSQNWLEGERPATPAP